MTSCCYSTFHGVSALCCELKMSVALEVTGDKENPAECQPHITLGRADPSAHP